MDEDMSFDEVHSYCVTDYAKFSLSQVTVGEFTASLEGSDMIYKCDSRSYDQDLNHVSISFAN